MQERLTPMKILIVGSVGREHAMGWKVAQSARAGQIYFAPGNGGTEKIGINVNIPATDIPKLVEFAKKEKIDLTMALSDDPLALGIVNELEKEGLRIFGPTKEAAELEWSKAFSKEFMARNGLPTADFEVFDNFTDAKFYLEKCKFPVVIKASGLALGKGVVIAGDKGKATETLEDILVNKIFGESGAEVVIEEFLEGTEVSVHAFTDGKTYRIFPISQDHKKAGEGNTGPNTGGMGTIAPVPFVNDEQIQNIRENIVSKTLAKMREEGKPFKGVLYPGLMLTKDGPKILEYNARFGDPETQTYLRLLETDILDIIDACIDGTLEQLEIKWKDLSACTVVLASQGYPGNYEKGKEIKGIDAAEMEADIVVFHAGTLMK